LPLVPSVNPPCPFSWKIQFDSRATYPSSLGKKIQIFILFYAALRKKYENDGPGREKGPESVNSLLADCRSRRGIKPLSISIQSTKHP
jgi:hypothetical protein